MHYIRRLIEEVDHLGPYEEKGAAAMEENKTKIVLRNDTMQIDLQKQEIDLKEIHNRKFLYNPDIGKLLLSAEYGPGFKPVLGVDIEHFVMPAHRDQFICGWVGTSSEYPNGIIHFTPSAHFDTKHKSIYQDYERAFLTLEMFEANGADKDTVIRNFGNVYEQPFQTFF